MAHHAGAKPLQRVLLPGSRRRDARGVRLSHISPISMVTAGEAPHSVPSLCPRFCRISLFSASLPQRVNGAVLLTVNSVLRRHSRRIKSPLVWGLFSSGPLHRGRPRCGVHGEGTSPRSPLRNLRCIVPSGRFKCATEGVCPAIESCD